MIKIERTPAPVELTAEVIAAKTAAFKANHGLAVWREPYIIRGLLEMSHNKCCYCECILDEESKYMEVEHFHHKDKYEDEVVVWDNLLPSCKKCNVHKGDHDTKVDPMINPTKQNPKDHLALYCYQLRGKTDIGELTETLLNLNDTKHHVLPRFKICNMITSILADLYEDAIMLSSGTPKAIQTRFRNRLIRVLELCQPDEPYTAVKATIVTNDKKYKEIIKKLTALGLWVEPLIALDATMRKYQLDME